jgi:hypothetical protein
MVLLDATGTSHASARAVGTEVQAVIASAALATTKA